LLSDHVNPYLFYTQEEDFHPLTAQPELLAQFGNSQMKLDSSHPEK